MSKMEDIPQFEHKVSSLLFLALIIILFRYQKQKGCMCWGHLHFTGTELKSSYVMMGVTSSNSDGHVTLV